MGKEQFNTFDALVASYSMLLIRYLIVVFILNKYELQDPIGPIFKKISDNNLYLFLATKMWKHIKDSMITSSDLICYQIEHDTIIHFLDLIKEIIRKHMSVLSVKRKKIIEKLEYDGIQYNPICSGFY
ncbi:MAG: hypothetical protein ACFFDT_06150 [Candidatus Hodarchaeota archaeon]